MTEQELAIKEQKLEALCAGRGLERYTGSLDRNRKQHTETKAKQSPAQVALAESIAPMVDALDTLFEEQKLKRGPKQLSVKFLINLGSEVAAYLTAMAVLDSLSSQPQETKVSLKIAGYFIDELRYRHFAEYAEALFNWRIKSFNTSSYTHMKRSMDATLLFAQQPQGEKPPAVPPVPEWLENLDAKERGQVGAFALDIFIASTGKVQKTTIWTAKNREMNLIQATEETEQWMRQVIDQNGKLAPVSLPMIIRPEPWSRGKRGGYIFSEGNGLAGRFPLMRSNNPKASSTALDDVEMPVVYEALNAIQNTPYLINKQVLDVMNELFDNDTKGIPGLPLADKIKLPPKPHDIETNSDARKVWRKQASVIHEQNHEMACARVSFNATRSVAQLMLSQVDDVTGQPLPFFFPHNLDFRGRTYPIPVYLQPQGHDVARGLLLFGTKKRLGSQEAVDWLCIHGANNLGKTAAGEALDKASFEERIQWVLDHSDQICAAASYPADFRSFWAGDNVDNPWQFLAFCFEWKKFCDTGRSLDFECSLPGSMDGSCNGLQHYAALLKDEELAKSVNLIPSQVPQDIYRVVAAEVNRRLRADTSNDLAKAWIQWGKVDRKFVKRQVMTLPYGSGQYGFKNQIKEYLKGLNDKQRPKFWKGEIYPQAVSYMAGLIFQSLATSSKSAVEAMEFFKVCARLAAKSDAPILWTAPNGLPVQQAYPTMVDNRINTMLAGGIRCQLRLKTPAKPEDKVRMLNAKKQVSGIAPNIIHSLDASALMLTVKQALGEGIDHFLMVHDSFGCHMADAPRLSEIIRETFVKMYAGSTVLDGLVIDLEANINVAALPNGKSVPVAPSQGVLDITEVLGSKYFFA